MSPICGHIICVSCKNKLLVNSSIECPTCKKKIDESFIHNIFL